MGGIGDGKIGLAELGAIEIAPAVDEDRIGRPELVQEIVPPLIGGKDALTGEVVAGGAESGDGKEFFGKVGGLAGGVCEPEQEWEEEKTGRDFCKERAEIGIDFAKNAGERGFSGAGPEFFEQEGEFGGDDRGGGEQEEGGMTDGAEGHVSPEPDGKSFA